MTSRPPADLYHQLSSLFPLISNHDTTFKEKLDKYIELGGDINATLDLPDPTHPKYKYNGLTLIMEAAQSANASALEAILSHPTSITDQLHPTTERPLLSLLFQGAISSTTLHCAKILLQAHSPVRHRDSQHISPLEYILRSSEPYTTLHLQLVTLLLQHEASVLFSIAKPSPRYAVINGTSLYFLTSNVQQPYSPIYTSIMETLLHAGCPSSDLYMFEWYDDDGRVINRFSDFSLFLHPSLPFHVASIMLRHPSFTQPNRVNSFGETIAVAFVKSVEQVNMGVYDTLALLYSVGCDLRHRVIPQRPPSPRSKQQQQQQQQQHQQQYQRQRWSDASSLLHQHDLCPTQPPHHPQYPQREYRTTTGMTTFDAFLVYAPNQPIGPAHHRIVHILLDGKPSADGGVIPHNAVHNDHITAQTHMSPSNGVLRPHTPSESPAPTIPASSSTTSTGGSGDHPHRFRPLTFFKSLASSSPLPSYPPLFYALHSPSPSIDMVQYLIQLKEKPHASHKIYYHQRAIPLHTFLLPLSFHRKPHQHFLDLMKVLLHVYEPPIIRPDGASIGKRIMSSITQGRGFNMTMVPSCIRSWLKITARVPQYKPQSYQRLLWLLEYCVSLGISFNPRRVQEGKDKSLLTSFITYMDASLPYSLDVLRLLIAQDAPLLPTKRPIFEQVAHILWKNTLGLQNDIGALIACLLLSQIPDIATIAGFQWAVLVNAILSGTHPNHTHLSLSSSHTFNHLEYLSILIRIVVNYASQRLIGAPSILQTTPQRRPSTFCIGDDVGVSFGDMSCDDDELQGGMHTTATLSDGAGVTATTDHATAMDLSHLIGLPINPYARFNPSHSSSPPNCEVTISPMPSTAQYHHQSGRSDTHHHAGQVGSHESWQDTSSGRFDHTSHRLNPGNDYHGHDDHHDHHLSSTLDSKYPSPTSSTNPHFSMPRSEQCTELSSPYPPRPPHPTHYGTVIIIDDEYTRMFHAKEPLFTEYPIQVNLYPLIAGSQKACLPLPRNMISMMDDIQTYFVNCSWKYVPNSMISSDSGRAGNATATSVFRKHPLASLNRRPSSPIVGSLPNTSHTTSSSRYQVDASSHSPTPWLDAFTALLGADAITIDPVFITLTKRFFTFYRRSNSPIYSPPLLNACLAFILSTRPISHVTITILHQFFTAKVLHPRYAFGDSRESILMMYLSRHAANREPFSEDCVALTHFLLQSGVDPNHLNTEGRHVLYHVLANKAPLNACAVRIVELLLSHHLDLRRLRTTTCHPLSSLAPPSTHILRPSSSSSSSLTTPSQSFRTLMLPTPVDELFNHGHDYNSYFLAIFRLLVHAGVPLTSHYFILNPSPITPTSASSPPPPPTSMLAISDTPTLEDEFDLMWLRFLHGNTLFRKVLSTFLSTTTHPMDDGALEIIHTFLSSDITTIRPQPPHSLYAILKEQYIGLSHMMRGDAERLAVFHDKGRITITSLVKAGLISPPPSFLTDIRKEWPQTPEYLRAIRLIELFEHQRVPFLAPPYQFRSTTEAFLFHPDHAVRVILFGQWCQMMDPEPYVARALRNVLYPSPMEIVDDGTCDAPCATTHNANNIINNNTNTQLNPSNANRAMEHHSTHILDPQNGLSLLNDRLNHPFPYYPPSLAVKTHCCINIEEYPSSMLSIPVSSNLHCNANSSVDSDHLHSNAANQDENSYCACFPCNPSTVDTPPNILLHVRQYHPHPTHIDSTYYLQHYSNGITNLNRHPHQPNPSVHNLPQPSNRSYDRSLATCGLLWYIVLTIEPSIDDLETILLRLDVYPSARNAYNQSILFYAILRRWKEPLLLLLLNAIPHPAVEITTRDIFDQSVISAIDICGVESWAPLFVQKIGEILSLQPHTPL